MSSYFSTISMKKHKYPTKESVSDMKWSEIIGKIDPKDIPSHIESTKGKLNRDQDFALHHLVTLKKLQKEHPSIDINKYKIDYIKKKTGKVDPEVQKMMDQTAEEIKKEHDLNNRLRKLEDKPTIPYPPAVADYMVRTNQLPSPPKSNVKGGKTRRYQNINNKRKSRKNKKGKHKKSRKIKRKRKSITKKRKVTR